MSSTITLIVILVILVLALLILPFSKELMKDKQELRATPIEKKFKVVIDEINAAFLDGKGTIHYPVQGDGSTSTPTKGPTISSSSTTAREISPCI